jgi:hypothetical protein
MTRSPLARRLSVRPWCAVVLLCLAALTGCGGHQAPAAHGLVPWTDEQAQAAQLAQSTTLPTCRVSALHLPRDQQQWGGVWNDAVSGYFMLQSSARRPCELPPPSRVTATVASGERTDFDVGGLGAPTVVLDPGDRVQVQVSSPYDCGRPLVRSTAFTLAFPGGTLHVPGAHMAVQCGGALVDFSGRNTATSGSGRTGTPASSRLRATMSRVPDRAAPGDAVTYAVTLSNLSSTAITLDPCPSYQEGIKGQGASVHTYQLNCSAVARIDAHESVSFAMQLPLPTRLRPGTAVLDWKLQVPSGSVDDDLFASATIRIE